MLLDVFGSLGLSGKEAEKILESIGISVNKNMIPFDSRKPLDPSWIRIGTAAITTRGFDARACRSVAKIMIQALKNPENTELLQELKRQVNDLGRQFPIPLKFI